MALAVRQTKTFETTSALTTSPISITLDSAVLAGSLLVVVGSGVYNPTYTFSRLSSVSDTQSNTWTTPVNVDAAGSAAVYGSYAMNVAAGSTTVSLTLSNAADNRASVAVFEITGAATTSALDMTASGTASTLGTTVSTSATATLAQANNIAIKVGAGAFGNPSAAVGYTEVLSTTNGGTRIGTQIEYLITAATTALTGVVNHESVAVARHALLMVLKEAAAVTTYEYKFEFDTSTFTDADTGISGYVWRNGTPATVLAESYTGLAGDANAGDLIVTPANPDDVRPTDTITGIFYNGTDTSGLVAGVVQAA